MPLSLAVVLFGHPRISEIWSRVLEMIINKGDIFWINLPEGNSIAHPHVVIENSELLVVCGITTNMKKVNWPGNILLEPGEANLSKQSIIDVSQVYVVEKKQLGAFIGRLDNKRLEQIFYGMKLVQSL